MNNLKHIRPVILHFDPKVKQKPDQISPSDVIEKEIDAESTPILPMTDEAELLTDEKTV